MIEGWLVDGRSNELRDTDVLVNALVTAAGSGTRMGSKIPKQYLELAGDTLVSRSINTLLAVPVVQHTVVTLAPDDALWQTLAVADNPGVTPVPGGASRARSVLAGLKHLQGFAAPESWVLVHDAARPLVRADDIERLMHDVEVAGACGGLLAVPVTDTIKLADDQHARVATTPNRQLLWQAQTPQFFQLGQLHDAITAALANGIVLTDESSALEAQGLAPLLVEGRSDNIKITRAADIALAELLLQQHENR